MSGDETTTKAPRSLGLGFIGPALVLALVATGPGDFVSNSVAGARHGLGALWLVALGMIFRFVWLNTAAKYVLVTGESLMTGLSRCGSWVGWVTFFSVLVEAHVRNLFKYLLMGGCLHLVAPLPTAHSAFVWSVVSIGAGFLLSYFPGYRTIEWVFKALMGIMITSLAVAAVRSDTATQPVLGSLFPAVVPGGGTTESFVILAALIGTSVGSVTNLVYCYFLDEKGWRGPSSLGRQRADLALSTILTFIVALLLQTVAARGLGGTELTLDSPVDLVHMFTSNLGNAGRYIYGFGLWAAAFTGYVGITSGFGMVATDIWRNHLRPKDRQDEIRGHFMADPVYRLLVAFWCLSPLYVLFTDWKPLWIVLAVNASVMLLQPALTIALLIITAGKRHLGEFRNTLLTNLMLTALLLCTAYVAYQALVL